MLSTVQDMDTQTLNEDLDEGFRKIVAIVTWIVIILIPTYSVTLTRSTGDGIHPGIYITMREKSFLFPWMILTRYTPSVVYDADQFAVVAFPWSFILFIPFLYALRASWQIYSTNEQKALNSAYIIIASIVQLFLIFMTYQSQTSKAANIETISVYYIPQIMLIVLHSIIGFRWYVEELGQARKKLKV